MAHTGTRTTRRSLLAMRLGLLAFGLAVLAGCGGGGGGGEPDPEVNSALPASLTLTLPGTRQALGQAMSFDAGLGGSTSGLSFRWDFGDGSTSDLAAPQHAYTAPGEYTLRLTVANTRGESRSAQSIVRVADLALVQGRHCSAVDSGGWCWQRPLPQGNALNDFAFGDAQRVWTVGEGGMVMTSADGGQTWNRQNTPTRLDLLRIATADAQVLWVAGSNGEVLRSVDGGANWALLGTGRNDVYTAVVAIDAQRAAVLGSGIQYTDDGGRLWRTVTAPANIHGAPMLARDGSIWILNYYDTANGGGWVQGWLKSTDGGQNWTQGALNLPPPASGLNRSYERLVLGNAQTAILSVNDAGWDSSGLNWISTATAFRTVDGGISWQALGPAPNDSAGSAHYALTRDGGLFAQVSSNSGPGYFSTVDGGATWTALTVPEIGNLRALLPRSSGNLVAISWSGNAYLSTDGGARWIQPQTGGTAALPTLTSIAQFGRRQSLALAEDGSSLRSSDGGLTWTASSAAGGSSWRRAQFLADGSLGWLISDSGNIYRSTDQGSTWMAPVGQTSMSLGQVQDFHFIDALRGWAIGGNWWSPTLYRTSDGGQSWQQATTSPGDLPQLTTLRFSPDGLHGVAVGAAGLALVTDDGGQSWSWAATGSGASMRRLAFTDPLTVVAVGESGQILRSSDGGKNWRRMASPTTLALADLQFVTPLLGWAVGEQGTVLVTRDAGLSWQAQDSGTRANLMALNFIDAFTGWIVGANGVVLATVSGGQ